MKSLLSFTEEHEMYRAALGSFLDKEVVPVYAEWEEAGGPPRELYKKLGDNGYICTSVDEKYGGVNGDFLYDYIFCQELALRGINSLTAGMHSGIGAVYLNNCTSEEQKARWLPGCVSGEKILAVAMTEPSAGSDLMGMRTRAVKDGDYYILNGSKTFISNGTICDYAIVACKTDPNAGHKGVSLIMVESGTEGFSRGKRIPKIGFHAGDTTELFFEDCRVPANNLIGKEGEGFKILMTELQQERLLGTVTCVFMARHSLNLALEYVQQRQLFGKKLSDFQNTQFVLADIATEIELAEAFLEKLTIAHMKRENVVSEVSMAKLWIAEMSHRVASRCLQLFGGYGYCTEYEISRQFIDTRIFSIFAGSSEVMKGIIAKSLGL